MPSHADAYNRHPDRRELILEAAEALIASSGIEGLTLKEVARRVNIQPPSIYTHFKSLDALSEAVAERVYRSFADLYRAPDDDMDAHAALRRHLSVLVDHLAADGIRLRFLLRDFAQMRAATKDKSTPSEQQILRAFQNVGEILRQGQREGVFRRVKVERYLAYILGAALIALSWNGFDQEGRPQSVAPIPTLKRDLFRMARGYLDT